MSGRLGFVKPKRDFAVGRGQQLLAQWDDEVVAHAIDLDRLPSIFLRAYDLGFLYPHCHSLLAIFL